MATDRPTPGRCGARTRSGGYCARYPTRGRSRCRNHGGGGADAASGRPITHGRYAAKFHRVEAAMQDRIEQALLDPDLLDARRGVALQMVLLGEHGLVPDDESVYAMAEAMMAPAERDAGAGPSRGLMEIARLRFLEQSMRAVEMYARAMAIANRQVRKAELINAELAPVMRDFGNQLRLVVQRYLPSDQQQAFVAEVQMAVRQALVRASQIDA